MGRVGVSLGKSITSWRGGVGRCLTGVEGPSHRHATGMLSSFKPYSPLMNYLHSIQITKLPLRENLVYSAFNISMKIRDTFDVKPEFSSTSPK